jgi:hypothetical protein
MIKAGFRPCKRRIAFGDLAAGSGFPLFGTAAVR